VHVTLVCLCQVSCEIFLCFAFTSLFHNIHNLNEIVGFLQLHHSILMLFVILGCEFLLSAGVGLLYGRICHLAATGKQSSSGIPALWLPKVKRFRGT
jgi:hypothetical protein